MLLNELAYRMNLVYNDIKYIHLNAYGPDFLELHEISQEYYNKLHEDIDTISEMALKNKQKLIGFNVPFKFDATDYVYLTNVDKIPFDDGIKLLTYYLRVLVDWLKSATIESEGDRVVIAQMIAYYDKEVEYKLIRRGMYDKKE